MKKSVFLLLLTLSITSGLWGCGSDSTSTEVSSNFDPKVAIGSDYAAGYTGFQYLAEQTVSTSNTKSGNEVTFSVYIPDGENPILSDTRMICERSGVYFSINIEPDLRPDAETYTVEENLQYFMNDKWASVPSNYYAVSIGEVQKVDETSADCTVTLVRYADGLDEYRPMYAYYYMKDMGDGIIAIAEMEIGFYDTTDETSDILAELSSFYGLKVGWNESYAESKLAEFKNSAEYNPDAYNLGYMTFELPADWARDEKETVYGMKHVFALNGNLQSSDVALIFREDYTTKDFIGFLLDNKENVKKYVDSFYTKEHEINDISVTDLGNTFIGHTVALQVGLSHESGDQTATYYIGQDNGDIYNILFIIYDRADEQDIQKGHEAVNMVFETGQLIPLMKTNDDSEKDILDESE